MNTARPAITKQRPWLPATGTREYPISHGGPDRVGHYCRCFRCGLTTLCGPEHDFYTMDDPGGPLFCEDCMWHLAVHAIRLDDPFPDLGPSQPQNN